MGEEAFRVSFAADAWADLDELADFWIARGEGWRAEKYSRDLVRTARAELILAFGIYRIIYEIDEAQERVEVLRFWHAHRDDPPFR